MIRLSALAFVLASCATGPDPVVVVNAAYVAAAQTEVSYATTAHLTPAQIGTMQALDDTAYTAVAAMRTGGDLATAQDAVAALAAFLKVPPA